MLTKFESKSHRVKGERVVSLSAVCLAHVSACSEKSVEPSITHMCGVSSSCHLFVLWTNGYPGVVSL